MSDWRNLRTVEWRTTTLSFAVRLVDAFTRERPAGDRRVWLRNVDIEPVTNPSGYHLFLDLSAKSVQLVVDGGDQYFEKERTVVLGDGSSADADTSTTVVTDPARPVVVELTPTPAYRFPARTTLVRGHVVDADGDPVGEATVLLREFDPSTETTERGEFALFVPVTAENVVRKGDMKLVKVDEDGGNVGGTGDDFSNPTIEVTHPEHDTVAERLEVEAGTRTIHHLTLD